MILWVVTPIGPFPNGRDFTFDVNLKLGCDWNFICFIFMMRKAILGSSLSTGGALGGTLCPSMGHRDVW